MLNKIIEILILIRMIIAFPIIKLLQFLLWLVTYIGFGKIEANEYWNQFLND